MDLRSRSRTMRIGDSARAYCEQRGVARTVVFSANRFCRYAGDLEVSEINAERIADFITRARSDGLSEWTIKGTLKDLKTVAGFAGVSLIVPAVKTPRPTPRPTPLSSIDKIWPHVGSWCQQWLAIAFWTALRLDDSIELQLTGLSGETIRWTASKTGRQHVWPCPQWLRKFADRIPLPYSRAADHSQVLIRAELERCSRLASVDRVTPKQIRQASLNSWSKANATAGAIVHGCGLGVLSHYLDPLQILESAAPRVRLPECFGATSATGEESLLANFRRLDQSAQDLIAGTAERLAAG